MVGERMGKRLDYKNYVVNHEADNADHNKIALIIIF